ncbi:MAG: PspC domain-containing protein [Chlorobi bacterium]|nr:PspC domain-containing protein [Chlorobiota bacterium]
MKKTVTVNLNGLIFYIDEDAYLRLSNYLEKVEKWFTGKEGAREIIADIESRIAELFEEKVKPGVGVVDYALVEHVIGIMGEPEEFDDLSDSNEKNASNFTSSGTYIPPKKLYRDIDNRVFGGVCSGIAAYLNLDITLVRVIFAILPFLSVGVIIPIYIVLWIALPPAVTTAEKLQMRGEPINISNIEKTIKDEYEDVKKRVSRIKDTETYQKGKNFFQNLGKNDKTVLIVAGILLAATFLIPSFHTSYYTGTVVHNFIPGMQMNFPGNWHIQIFYSGVLKIVLVLAIMGIVYKPALKSMLYAIVALLLITVIFKIIFFLFGSVALMM